MHPHRSRRLARSAVVSALAISSVSLLTGCGDDTGALAGQSISTIPATTPSSGNPASSTTALSPKDAALAFARCMREHGVDMEDPGPDGRVIVRGSNPGDESTVDEATKVCQPLLAAGEPPSGGGNQAEQKAKFLAMAACVRANGYPDFPDPEITDDGGLFKVLMRADPALADDPDFQRVQQRCTTEAGLPEIGSVG